MTDQHKPPAQSPPERLLLRVPEAAVVAAISRARAWQLVYRGEWPSIKIGASRRVPLDGLRAWVAQKQHETVQASLTPQQGRAAPPPTQPSRPQRLQERLQRLLHNTAA